MFRVTVGLAWPALAETTCTGTPLLRRCVMCVCRSPWKVTCASLAVSASRLNAFVKCDGKPAIRPVRKDEIHLAEPQPETEAGMLFAVSL